MKLNDFCLFRMISRRTMQLTMELSNHWTKRIIIGQFLITVLLICIIVSVIVVCKCEAKHLAIDEEVEYIGDKGIEKKLDVVNATNVELFKVNTTLCEYISQFEVMNSKKVVTVCKYQGVVRVDVIHFIGKYPTIRGIWLN